MHHQCGPITPAVRQAITHGTIVPNPRIPVPNPKTKSKKNAKRQRILKPWTREDLKQMKTLAGKKSAGAISRALKRTESAVRQKAAALAISLRQK